jgi:hypothetical protein
VSSIACIVDCDIVPNQSAGKNQSIDTAILFAASRPASFLCPQPDLDQAATVTRLLQAAAPVPHCEESFAQSPFFAFSLNPKAARCRFTATTSANLAIRRCLRSSRGLNAPINLARLASFDLM